VGTNLLAEVADTHHDVSQSAGCESFELPIDEGAACDLE
jgi:hypothetical protein